MNWIWLQDRAYNMDEVICIMTDKNLRYPDDNVIILECKDEGFRKVIYKDKKKFDKELFNISWVN